MIIKAKSRILSFNCEGVKNCMSYLSNLLKDTDCDILCLQETWTLDNTIDILGSIHNNYDFTGISGVSNDHLLRGRPSGGVEILIKKTLSKYFTFVKSPCKRISAIKIKCANNFSCLLVNVYFPCDNYSNTTVSDMYIECIDHLQSLFNNSECNSFICTGDFNTSFERGNAQCKYLTAFIECNNLLNSM